MINISKSSALDFDLAETDKLNLRLQSPYQFSSSFECNDIIQYCNDTICEFSSVFTENVCKLSVNIDDQIDKNYVTIWNEKQNLVVPDKSYSTSTDSAWNYIICGALVLLITCLVTIICYIFCSKKMRITNCN